MDLNIKHLCGAVCLLAGSLLATDAISDDGLSKAHENSYLYIGWPNNGEVIKGPEFRVWFGLRHMGVAPAGTEIAFTGHHHLLIDTPLPPLDEEIPSDNNHRHYGAGQTETVISLPPGKHTLQLLLADHNHIPHDPPVMSPQITITVK